MKTDLFDYHLPPGRIALSPARPRSASRLMVVHRDGGRLEHRMFGDLTEYLREGDVLVLNDSRVIRAKLLGWREDTGGKLDVLLLRETEPNVWETLVKPAKRARPGRSFTFGDGALRGTVVERGERGLCRIAFECEGTLLDLLESIGEVPLPPYLKNAEATADDYQTVYAREPGSVAAPTAGLHFTPELLEAVEARGVTLLRVTLHVGLGTFRPIHVDSLDEHQMHAEYVTVSAETTAALRQAKVEGRRVVAVGTTSVRTLETLGQHPEAEEFAGWTNLFIRPGFQFQFVDALVTNFHLPRSTLLVLVSAFAGRELMLRAYEEAVTHEYRFYSLGDAMLLV